MKLLRLLAACVLSFSSFAFASANTIELSDVSTKSVQYLSYDFGRVFVGSLNRVIYTIKNSGTVDVQREGFNIGGPYFEAYTNCPTVMPPATQCELEIRYWPSFEGSHFGRMQMLFTDRNDIVIDLYGMAFR